MMRSTCESSSVIRQNDKSRKGGGLLHRIAIMKLFSEKHITLKQNLGGHWIPAPITFCVITISQKIAKMNFQVQFAAMLLFNVCINLTPKNSEMLQGWLKTISQNKRCIARDQSRAITIQSVHNRVTRFSPKTQRKPIGVEERSNTFHNCANIPFTKTIRFW